ncbi:MAG: AI-2E family transporter [Deltaproteobacteria bacterium]|jgi:predicted PurR-regulated permease PerM|nr:AI-2E family transporter [Deltaproteobacteria bacterium]
MPFTIANFAKQNRVILIWTAFAGLIYIMRDMFGLIFMTFVMCFLTHSISNTVYRITKLRRKFLIIVIYILFVTAISSLLIFALPKVIAETKQFAEQLPETTKIIYSHLDSLVENNPSLNLPIEKFKESLTIEALVPKGWTMLRIGLEKTWHYLTLFAISTCFSFLIMLDLPNLMRKFRALRFSKVSSIYDETASSVIRFAIVVGENFRAQIFISCINTILTFTGLHIIGTGTTALLSMVVFCCGLIPVLGVLLSSVPILLVSINVGGLNMALAALVLIVIIHAIEAYVLNPRIVSAIMHINPVITLMILYVAHSVMGVWGMLLGVPITVYFYRQIMSNHKSEGDGKNGAKAIAQNPPVKSEENAPPSR